MRTASTDPFATAIYSESAGQADQVGGRQMSDVTAIVFVVDDDVSVRESLELLIRAAGWQPETFASALEFGLPSGRTCRSSSSPATATCR